MAWRISCRVFMTKGPYWTTGSRSGAPARRGGRPRKTAPRPSLLEGDVYELPNGTRLRGDRDDRGYLIRFEGSLVEAETVRSVLRQVYQMLRSGRS